MRSYRKEILFDVPVKEELIEITPEVAEALVDSGIQDGFVLCNSMHTTSSVFISNNDRSINEDYLQWLNKLAPHEQQYIYTHSNTDTANTDAFLKTQIMGRGVTIAVTNGELDLGISEQIFYGEFDGKKRKKILIKIIGE